MKKEPLFRYDEMADTIWVRADIWPYVNIARCIIVLGIAVAYIAVLTQAVIP